MPFQKKTLVISSSGSMFDIQDGKAGERVG